MALSNALIGLGSNATSATDAFEKNRAEARQRLYDQILKQQTAQQLEAGKVGISERKQAIQQRGQLSPLGAPIQQPDGSLIQVFFNPNTGQITSQKLPGIQAMTGGMQEAQTYQWILKNMGKDVADRLYPQAKPNETEFQKDWNKYAAADLELQKMGYKPGTEKYNQAFMTLMRGGASAYPLFDIPRFNPNSSVADTSGMTASEKRLFDAQTKPWQASLQRLQSELSQLELKQLTDPTTEVNKEFIDKKKQQLQDQIDQLTLQIEAAKNDIMGARHKPTAASSPGGVPEAPQDKAGYKGDVDIPEPVAPVRTSGPPKPSPRGAAPAKQSASPPPAIQRQMKEGDVATGPDGSKWVKRDGKVVPQEAQ